MISWLAEILIMAKKEIKLPLWFVSAKAEGKYDKAINLTHAEWSLEVERRLAYYSKENLGEVCQLTDEEVKSGYSKYAAIKQVQQEPVLKHVKQPSKSKWHTDEVVLELRVYGYQIDSLNNVKDSCDDVEPVGDDENYLGTDYGRYSDAISLEHSYKCVQVDISQPVSVIVKEFRNLLNLMIIEQQKPYIPFNSKSIAYGMDDPDAFLLEENLEVIDALKEKWVEYAVLPFLDLEFWAFENGIKLKLEFYATHIYKTLSASGVSKLDTTRVRVKEFLTVENMELLKRYK